MSIAVRPPLAPMLARLSRELPEGDFIYEPKWDGFRCLVFRSGDDIDLRSRHDSRFARYFPELVEALRSVPERSFALDGEIVIYGEDGFDFAALMNRIHPAATRVELLRAQSPAAFIAFDVLGLGEQDLRNLPFRERRAALERLGSELRPPLHVTPATTDSAVAAEWLDRFTGNGLDGVVAKSRRLLYQPNRRVMLKVKREKTAECVVAGFRLLDADLVASLLLGLYDAQGKLRHVGVSSSFSVEQRGKFAAELQPLVVPLEGHPWEQGFGIQGRPMGRLRGAAGVWQPHLPQDWFAIAPERVCEVAYDQLDRDRFRHPARFCRWRPDREPHSCTFEQLEGLPTASITVPLV